MSARVSGAPILYRWTLTTDIDGQQCRVITRGKKAVNVEILIALHIALSRALAWKFLVNKKLPIDYVMLLKAIR